MSTNTGEHAADVPYDFLVTMHRHGSTRAQAIDSLHSVANELVKPLITTTPTPATQGTRLRRHTPCRRHRARRSRPWPQLVDTQRSPARPRHHGLRRIPDRCCRPADTAHRRTTPAAAVPTGPRRV